PDAVITQCNAISNSSDNFNSLADIPILLFQLVLQAGTLRKVIADANIEQAGDQQCNQGGDDNQCGGVGGRGIHRSHAIAQEASFALFDQINGGFDLIHHRLTLVQGIDINFSSCIFVNHQPVHQGQAMFKVCMQIQDGGMLHGVVHCQLIKDVQSLLCM